MAIADEGLDQSRGDRVAVLEWRAWEGFLLTHVLGDRAVRIETDPFGEFPSGQFERICASCTAVCFQINLSVRDRLPLRIQDLAQRFVDRGIHVVNGLVQDVRKSTLQAHLRSIGLASLTAAPNGPAEEILFVKTDLNYGGELEKLLPPESIAAVGLAPLISRDIGAYHYQAFERGTIPKQTWIDAGLVIEKYVTNSENSFYRAYFSGQRIIIVKAFSAGMIKKLSGDDRDTNFVTDLDALKAGTDEQPISERLKADVAAFVEHTPVDFGCIDIVHDGRDEHYIIDLNLTPYAGTREYDAFLSAFLRVGIIDPHQRKVMPLASSPLLGNGCSIHKSSRIEDTNKSKITR
jgi:hypothetical protein